MAHPVSQSRDLGHWTQCSTPSCVGYLISLAMMRPATILRVGEGQNEARC